MKKYSLYEYVVMIIAALLIIALGIVAIWEAVGKSKERKEKVEWIKKCKAYENAPIETVTVLRDSIIYVEKVVYRPSEPVYIKQPVSEQPPCESRYSTPIRWEKDGLTWRFLATTYIKNCILDSMEISNAVLPKETIIQTRRIDTCLYKEPAYKPINHWGLMGGVDFNSFKRFPGADINLFYTYKDKWGLYGGVMYVNPNQVVSDAIGAEVSVWNNMYVRLGGIIYLK